MGIIAKLLGRGATAQPHASGAARAPVQREDALEIEGLIELSGTTTFARDALSALAHRHAMAAGGYLEIDGVLQREPNNAGDPNAVAAMVEGDRIGYLPSFLAKELKLATEGSRSIKVQVFAEVLPKGLRCEVWVWLGVSDPQWQWSELNRPPMTPQAKSRVKQESLSSMVDEALEQGGSRAAEFAAGTVEGVHYLELIEPIKLLKREGRLEEALELCYVAIAGAEGGRGGMEPAPAYTEQAAIIHRKLGQHDQEVAVLERWLAVCPVDRREGSGIAQRLRKLVPRP